MEMGKPHATPTAVQELAPILLVDDDEQMRTLLSIALGRAGLTTLQAPTAERALQIIGNERVSVVVCDLRMPGMSGLELIRALRRGPTTSTLPILLMTGSGDSETVIEGLEAGADDFLAKPVRLEELVARVRAHLRTHDAWTQVLDAELRSRADAVQAIGQLVLSAEPEEAAAAVVAELAHRTGSRFVGVLQYTLGERFQPLARFTGSEGLSRGGGALSLRLTRHLLAKANAGPWFERLDEPATGEPADQYWGTGLDIAAGAPIYAGDNLVGLLTLGAVLEPVGPPPAARQAKLLASAIDYASMLSAVAGPAIADRRQAAAEQERLRQSLVNGEFFPVYQPIVSLHNGGKALGYEALTRFADGTAPDVRFAEAQSLGLGPQYQLAAIRAAVEGAGQLPEGARLFLNISPDVIVGSAGRLERILRDTDRSVVLEVTEHARIADYDRFRRAVARLGDVPIAVDDAGAGYATLRHILELGPMFAKLDISLVRGIDGDQLRQALAAGLSHFATRTGCRLIAEGVERREEADVLRDLGVDFAQGYLFGRPQRLAA
jgi:EAL domain-containing protein (putative c-di-GMP-specific phosphodiesterase class I)/DNA-binding response OmpR family regulator